MGVMVGPFLCITLNNVYLFWIFLPRTVLTGRWRCSARAAMVRSSRGPLVGDSGASATFLPPWGAVSGAQCVYGLAVMQLRSETVPGEICAFFPVFNQSEQQGKRLMCDVPIVKTFFVGLCRWVDQSSRLGHTQS